MFLTVMIFMRDFYRHLKIVSQSNLKMQQFHMPIHQVDDEMHYNSAVLETIF